MRRSLFVQLSVLLASLALVFSGCPRPADDDDDDSTAANDDDSVSDDDDSTAANDDDATDPPESLNCPGMTPACNSATFDNDTATATNSTERYGDVCDLTDLPAGDAGWTGGEDVWEIVPEADGMLSVTVDATVDASGWIPGVFAFNDCTLSSADTCLGANTSDEAWKQLTDIPVTAGTPVYVVVDGWDGAAGAYDLWTTCPEIEPGTMGGSVVMGLDFINPSAQFVDCSDSYNLEDSGFSAGDCFECDVTGRLDYIADTQGCAQAWTSSFFGTVLNGDVRVGVDVSENRAIFLGPNDNMDPIDGSATGNAAVGTFTGQHIERPSGGSSTWCLDLDSSGSCDPGSEHVQTFTYDLSWQ